MSRILAFTSGPQDWQALVADPVVIPGQPQDIIQRGNNRQVIFAADADYQFFRDALVEAASEHGLAIHAYVWMTNHIHLLATPEGDHSISRVLQERECAEYAAGVVRRAVLAEGCVGKPLVLHADHGSPQQGSALRATLDALGVRPSYSRLRVSDDNAFSEAVFRTCKYRPDYPHGGFESLEAARDWVLQFVRWYHHEHRHSALRYVTPLERHERRDSRGRHRGRVE
jgi:integrase-like protein/transposase IS200 family protein